MKLIINTLLLFTLLTTLSCKSDDGISYDIKKVNNSVLSTNSTTYLKTYFSTFPIKSVNEYEPIKPNGALYQVNLNDVFLVDFDKVGNWISIEKLEKKDLPKNIIHQSIQVYTTKKYPEKSIEKIERNQQGYFVELKYDIDLQFNKNGEFIEKLK
jgi:hypothetical protein